MDAVAYLGSEDAIDQPVLGDPAEAAERRRGYHGVEVMAVACDLGAGAGYPCFDPFLQLFGRGRHALKRSDLLSLY